MQTDDLFYRIFQTFPELFFELIGNVSIDPSGYTFKSIQVKQTKLTMDGLFSPPDIRTQDPLYFIEVQFQPDPDLYYRLMAEIHLYIRQYKPSRPWQAVVLFPKMSIDTGIPVEYQVLDGSLIQRVFLEDLKQEDTLSPGLGLVHLIIEPEVAAEAQVKRLLEQTRRQIQDPNIQRRILELIETVLVYKFPHKSRGELEVMFGLTELKQTRVYQEAQKEEAVAMVNRAVKRRLGSVDPALLEKIGNLSTQQLEELIEALFDLATEADLSAWLEKLAAEY